jgi:predicted hydrocarbon binding protein
MTDYYYPERMGRIILMAMEEVLGREGLNSTLRIASLSSYIGNYPPASSDKTFSFETVGKLLESLEMAYGPQGGRGTALRVGRACFQYGLREYGLLMGITELAYRLLPFPTRLRTGANSFAALFNEHTDQRVKVEEKDGKLVWSIERCPLCWQRKANEPVCHLAVGLIQESLYWLSSGKIFDVEEVACIARGDPACEIVIDPTPLPS